VVLTVNTRYVVTGHALVSLGTLNECIAHPRDIFRPAVALGAYGILLMHNHPSGVSRTKRGRSALNTSDY